MPTQTKSGGGSGTSLPALSDNGTIVTSTEPIVLPSGAKNATALQFSADGATTGLYRNSAGTYVWSIANNGYYWFGNADMRVGNNMPLNFSSGDTTTVTTDTGLVREAVGTLSLKNGANDQHFRVYGATGGLVEYGTTTELLTIAAAATTDSVGNLLPANSIIDAVNVRVTTVIPTAATFTVGDATIAARFATGVSVAATTTAVGDLQVDQTGTSGPRQVAAAKVRITPNLTPGTATGVVRITVHYHSFTPPTS